ncbi:MAG: SpoIIE family protein phosphatase [Bacteroidales bacterium]|nr:SpoIIE family protein phosphatase [Bacteroidales bacterium]
MKNFISYTLVIFFSSLFILTGLKTKNLLNNSKQKIEKSFSEKDTNINKLPEGYQYISNFSFKKNKKISSVTQDSSGVMLFTNNTGIIFFDGKNERNLFIKDAPNIIKKYKKTNSFFIACRKGFGMLTKDKTGAYIYQSLSEKRRHNENYSDIVIISEKIFFINEKKIVSIKPDNPEETTIEYVDEKNTINHAFEHKGDVYLNLNNSGIHIFKNDSIIQIVNNTVFSDYEILFDIPFNESLILGTSDNELFLFDGNNYSRFNTSSDDYIKESVITGGTDYDKDWFVITTLNGGAIIINKNTGNAEYTINYRTGLLDDEIITSYVCNSGGLWLSHEYGISRAAFDIPVKNFGNYPGIQGKINSIQVFDSTLYVATGEGLYYLSEIKSYDEVKIATDKWVKSRIKINANTNNISPAYNIVSDTDDEINEDDSEDAGFFKRWRKRRDNKKENDETDDDITEPEATDDNYEDSLTKEERYKTEYKKVTEYRKIYELQSVKYSYKKISGINSKCKFLKPFNNGLLAVTNSGLYFVKAYETKTIIPDEYIYDISGKATDNIIFAATSKGIYKIHKSSDNISAYKIENEKPEYKKIKRLYKINDTAIWAGYLNKLFLFKFKKNRISSSEQFKLNSDINEDVIITKYKNRPVFISSDNAFYLNNEINDIVEDNELNKLIRNADNIYFTSDTSYIIYGQNNSVSQININQPLPYLKYAWLVDYVENLTFDNAYNIWLVSRDNMIYKISPEKYSNRNFNISIIDIKDKEENSLDNFSDIKLGSNYKRITIYLSSPCFFKNDFVTYYYGIDTNNEKDFIESSKSKIIIPELTSGNHIIYLFAVNEINEKSETIKINIEINPPFWQTNHFLIAVFVVFILLISLLISGVYRIRQRKIKEYNEILELKVKERTVEIKIQNKQIQKQNSEIIEQNRKIVYQNEEITGSIKYARKIQKAALPETDIQSKYLSGFFNLFKPRDIVSGDFYWMTEAQNKLFIAAVDCTGHGVPGGFLSMLGISFLNEIVTDMNKKTEDIKAADILNVLRNKMITTLSQHNEHTTHDGMDMALVIIDKENMLLNYAGANNPAYIIRKNRLSKITANRMPIGFNKKLNDIDFTNKFLKLKMNDSIYLFSDGYADQFGGENNKKFNSRRFRELLIHLQKFPMVQQKDIAETILKRWQKDNIQIDDILLIGIQI